MRLSSTRAPALRARLTRRTQENAPTKLWPSVIRSVSYTHLDVYKRQTLKSAVSVGIGLFVAFVGLQNAKLIVNSDSTLVTYQHFKGEEISLLVALSEILKVLI